jgi:3-dehydroquinate synthetase
MAIEAKLSVRKGLLGREDLQRILDVLKRFDLPTRVEKGVDWMDPIRKDKKREGSVIHAVLLEGIGKARVERIELSEIERMIDDLC